MKYIYVQGTMWRLGGCRSKFSAIKLNGARNFIRQYVHTEVIPHETALRIPSTLFGCMNATACVYI